MKRTGKKLFTIFEFYEIMTLAFRSIPLLRRAKAAGRMNKAFLERIMLAVTEVNGCAMCSFFHTKVALEAGFPAEEIRNMLGGDLADVPEDELEGVLFAQHYADLRGKPSRECWERVEDIYGETGAYGVLAVTRMIMLGNAVGIPSGSFLNRFRKRPDPRSSLLYEFMMLLALLISPLPAGVTALAQQLLNVPILSF